MVHVKLDVLPGDMFGDAANIAYDRALRKKESVEFRFNGVTCVFIPSAEAKIVGMTKL